MKISLHHIHEVTGGFSDKRIEPEVHFLVRQDLVDYVQSYVRGFCNELRGFHINTVLVLVDLKLKYEFHESEFERRINA